MYLCQSYVGGGQQEFGMRAGAESVAGIVQCQRLLGAACDSRNTRISHELRAIGLPDNVAKGTIRISLDRENTEADVRLIVDALKVAV